MHLRRTFWAALALSSTLVAGASPALAGSPQDKKEAAKALVEARAAFKKQQWDEAARAFKKAESLDPSAQTLLDLSRSYVKGGKLVEASKMLHLLTDNPPSSANGKKIAKEGSKLLGEIEGKIPQLTITVVGQSDSANVKISVDDAEVDPSGEVAVNPGDHHVSAEADGYAAVGKDVSVGGGEHAKVKLTLKKSDSSIAGKSGDSSSGGDSSSSGGFSKAPAIVSYGIGAIGIGMGVAFGVMSQSQVNDVKSKCGSNGVCPSKESDALDRAKMNGNVSTGAFIVGGAGVALGTVFLIASLSGKKGDDAAAPKKEEAGIHPWFGGTSIGVNGKF